MGRVFYDKMTILPGGFIAKVPTIEYKGKPVAALKEVKIPVKLDWDINKVTIGVVLKHPNAKLPEKKQGNIGIDLACVEDSEFVDYTYEEVPKNYETFAEKGTTTKVRKQFTLKAGQRHLFSTGVHLNIPDGWAIEFGDRSGFAAKHGLTVLGGKIDSSYTGELKVVLLNTSDQDVIVQPGERICQMIVTRDWDSQFVLSDDLKDSERGEKGFGSSGR